MFTLSKGFSVLTDKSRLVNAPLTKEKLTYAVNEFKRKRLYTGQWSPSDLRHSFAVNYLKNGGEIKKLQYILGHQKLHDTKRLYGETLNLETKEILMSPFE